MAKKMFRKHINIPKKSLEVAMDLKSFHGIDAIPDVAAIALGKQLQESIDAKVLASIQAAVSKVAEDIAFGHKINNIHLNPDTGEVEVQMDIQPKHPLDTLTVEFAISKEDTTQQIEDRFKAILDEVE